MALDVSPPSCNWRVLRLRTWILVMVAAALVSGFQGAAWVLHGYLPVGVKVVLVVRVRNS